MSNLVIAVTSGEPAGIGPDICLDLARFSLPYRPIVIGDLELLRERARRLNKSIVFTEYNAHGPAVAGALEVLHVPALAPVEPGRLDPRNSPYVLSVIDRAYDGCSSGEFAAMVTAPVSKAVINDADIVFTGHTEYLADRAGGSPVVMMLVGGGLRVALATTHLALSDVPAAISPVLVSDCLRVLAAGLRDDFGIAEPKIMVAGLNPHSGEGGHLGREEIDVIQPVIDRLRQQGMRLTGPVPADTLFNPTRLRDCDCVLAMYHDQGLPVLKYASFGAGVNVTLGLPVVRTSVDHGTALDLAGSGKAESGSLLEAVELAITIAKVRRAGRTAEGTKA